MAGLAVGGVFGILLAGQLEHASGWRVAFFVVGLPGFLLAALTLRLREPARVVSPPRPHAKVVLDSMTELGVAAARRDPSRGHRTASRAWETVALALLAYVPFLLSSAGKVSADTKQYLYLDPGSFLARAPYLWDAHVGLGTVPHQQIGYLFPMGPFFWLFDQLGVPVWVTQRLWLGSIVFLAALGARWLFREVGIGRVGALAGALVYMLTPYQLAYTGRISAILLPWAGLPWLIALTVRAVRRGGWREPALFALVVLVVGSTNATALLLVGLAPVLWLLFAVLNGDTDVRGAVGVALRIGVLCFFTSLWWIAGLVLQGGYGINYLDVSETVRTVAATGSRSAPSPRIARNTASESVVPTRER